MKKIKIMNMLLGGLLVLGSLTACGGGDDSTQGTGISNEGATEDNR